MARRSVCVCGSSLRSRIDCNCLADTVIWTSGCHHDDDEGRLGRWAVTSPANVRSKTRKPSASEYKPLESLTLEALYVPVRRVRARVTWQIVQPLRAYVGFDWDHDHFYRADREDKSDKIFYYEKRLTAGLRFDLRHVGFEVSGGYALDRFYYEGESYSDRNDNRIDVGAGPFVVGRVNIRF